ncbi:hypothetical protein FRB90_004282 [Tulasnella sp. 427]|nr:hypothetical protein FRB90_004282 [Tulasnella sp. 427]
MEASDLAQWKRFAAKGGIGKCTAIVDCAAETPGDLMFFQEDEITVLTPIEGQEGRYLGYCEGVVGQFSGDDVRFHGKLKTTVAVRRITGVSTPSTSSLGHASPPLPAQESSFSSSEPQSQATSRAASPSASPSLLSPRHTTRISTEQLSKYTLPTIPPSSSATSALLSPTREPTEAATSRSSLTSATETSLPHTPGDITENEHEAADPGVRAERNSASPRHSAEAPEKHHARAGDVVNALLEKVRYRDTTSSFGDDPLSLRDSVATMSSRADSLPLIPNAFRGSMIEEEEEEEDLQDGEEDTQNPDGEEFGIRDSIASSLTSSPPPRFSKPPPLSGSNPPPLDEDPLTTRDATRDSIASSYIKQSGVRDSVASSHYDDDEGVRASMASSDGGFGIGMQFIQGLIGNPTARSAESGYDDEEDDDEDVGSGRVTSMFTDESFHLPDWGTAARLPTQQEEDEVEEPSSLGAATTTRTSLEDKDPTPPANPASPVPNSSVPHTRTPSPRSSVSSYADEHNPQPAATSPSRLDGQADRRSMHSVDVVPTGSPDRCPETFESPTEAEFDPNGTSFLPGPQSPGFPGSGSEAGGSYYEEDLDIYDNYRYSRFSMLSRKSRKSQINMSFPDPSTMPALEDTIGSFPLPPPLNTSRTLPLRSDSSDRFVTSPKSASSFSQSSKGKQTSPNRFDFPPQPIQPLVLSTRKQLSVDTAPLLRRRDHSRPSPSNLRAP